MEASGVEPSRVVIAGGRDFDPEELEFIKANGILLVSTLELAEDLPGASRRIAERLSGHQVHVSFDIDVLDPAFAPGTEIPSAGGLSSRQALELLHSATERSRLVGLDVVSAEGEALGRVKSVHDFGAGDLLEIEPPQGPSWWLPFTREAVPEVSISERRITAVKPEETE